MAWIRTVPEDEADGPLRAIYAAARERAGKVFQILRIQSLRPKALAASMDMYLALMHGESALSRAEREMVAVVVSGANDCFY
jgi:uncharacterized peroxidase-related enzyme